MMRKATRQTHCKVVWRQICRPEWVGEGSKRDVGGWIYCYFEESKPEVTVQPDNLRMYYQACVCNAERL